MTVEIKDTIEAIGKAFETFKAENDKRLKELEAGKADPILAEKIDKINADLSGLSALKRQLEAIETAVALAQFPGGGDSGNIKAATEHRTAFNSWIRKGAEAGLRDLEIKAGLSTLSDPDGGFTIPTELNKTIRDIAQTLSSMRRLATVQSMGAPEYKELVDTGGETASWVGEKGTRSETDTAALVEVAWYPKELYAMPPVTQTMLDDSFMNVEAWVSKFIARAFAVKQGAAWFNGDGAVSPRGLNTYTRITNGSYAWGKIGYIAGGHASLLNDTDKLISLQHALKVIYRGSAKWLMNDSTLETVRKFKDGDGNYIFRPGLTEGAQDMLLGKPIEYDDNVDSIAANKYPIWYGDWKEGYLIVDKQGIRMLRDPYTSKPYVLFYTTMRTGGGVRNYEAIKTLKIATT